MLKKFWFDVVMGTAFIFAFLWLLSQLFFLKIFDIFDPVGETLSDMEVTDVVFSQLMDDPILDDRILLVNVGAQTRLEYIALLDSVKKYDPAAIGYDIIMYPRDTADFNYYPDEESIFEAMMIDTAFYYSLSDVDNLVMVNKLIYNEYTDEFDSTESSTLMPPNAMVAFANLITDAESQEDLKMCREFNPKLPYHDGKDVLAFSVKMASYIDSAKAARFLERENEVEVIKYRGNIIDYGATELTFKYTAIDWWEILEYGIDPTLVKDKLVIFCYLGDVMGDQYAFEDKFFSPMNAKYVGRAFPDMYGGVIHANIISMILDEDYIGQLTEVQKIVLAVFICFFNVMIFSWIYKRIPRWYDGLTKLIQAIEILGLLFAMVYVLDVFSVKLDLTLTLVVVALVGDSLEVYFGVVKNSLTKEGRKELFKVSKI